MGNFLQQPADSYRPLLDGSPEPSRSISVDEKKERKVCWKSLDGNIQGKWRTTFKSENEAIHAIKNALSRNPKIIYWIEQC